MKADAFPEASGQKEAAETPRGSVSKPLLNITSIEFLTVVAVKANATPCQLRLQGRISQLAAPSCH